MFKSYIKIALRNILRQKAYTIINILGLTIGLTVSLVIAFYVIDDLTYDNFHEEADSIYRVCTVENTNAGSMIYSITAGPLIPASVAEIPEISSAARINVIGRPQVANGDIPRTEMNETNSVRLQGVMTEKSFFEIFSFTILKGDREKILEDPNGILITPDAAEMLFGDKDPIGLPLTFQRGNLQDAYVAGIVEKPPLNSHIQFQFIIPLRVENNPMWWNSWENLALSAYIKTIPGSSEKILEEKMLNIARTNNMAEIYVPELQPLLDVHLGSAQHRYDGSNIGKNDKTTVYALALISLLVILIAAINFINLSTARASKRAREVGMRKVIGSNKSRLITQFLSESVFLTLLAMFLSIIIIQITLPFINDFIGKVLDINFISNPTLFFGMLGTAILIGVLAGLYPALVLSAFKPVTVLRGEFHKSKTGTLIRRSLVLLQFAITISLITGVLIIRDQIEHLKSLDLGYSRDQVITFFAPNNADDLFKERLSTNPGIISVGRTSGVLGANFIRYEVIPEGASRDNSQMFQQIAIDDNFFETLKITFKEGRNFDRQFTADTTESIIVNETAVKKAGWASGIGKRLDMVEIDGSITSKRIVGVVNDFHFTGARQEIEPLFFQLNTQNTFLFTVKIAGGKITETIEKIGNLYQEIYPQRNFNFQFLDDLFDRQFQADRNFATNIAYFSGFAIFIAALGLIGLIAFAVDQKRGEIAVRKVLGSSELSLVYILAKDFLKWVLLANIIAWPLTYFAISFWLESFVYRVSPSLLPYIIAGTSALVIAAITMLFQTIRAARTNPVNALRNE